jgi:hypothetical protein
MEEQVVDISRNMALLLADLANKFGTFREVGGSNSKNRFDEKGRDSETNKRSRENILKKNNQVLVPSLIHNIYSKWKQKWTPNPIKLRSHYLFMLNTNFSIFIFFH